MPQASGGPRELSALRLQKLVAEGFRNLEPLEFEPGDHFNVIHGENGAGKSNLLEAIHYLGALRSFRGARSEDLVALGQDQARVQARVVADTAPHTFSFELTRGKARRLSLDGKRPSSINAWHTSIQMVLFHPGDLKLARGGPEERRSFLDRILEQLDPVYGSTLADYQKALRSRNRLLKDDRANERSIRAFDPILANAGAVIGQARAVLIEDLAPRVAMAFERVVGLEVELKVVYQPRVEPDPAAILEALEGSLPKDRARGFTAEGPHGDELGLQFGAVAARHHASQGQHRAIVLGLKVAELDVLGARTGRVPILLLDDVSSELDRARNRRLFELLSHLGGQVFLTTTHPEFILLEEQRRDFEVKGGVLKMVAEDRR